MPGGRAARELLIGLAIAAATALSGCGSEPSQEELLAEFRAGAEATAADFNERYGMSEDAVDCIVEGAVDEAEGIDLSELSEDEIETEAAKLGEAAGKDCFATPGFALMVAEPTEAQATAVLEFSGESLKQGLVQGGLSEAVADCFLADAGALPPTAVASLLNGEPTPPVQKLIIACAKG